MIHKQREWFECVQVVERTPEGILIRWYDGEQRATPQEAKRDKRENRKEYPDTEFVVLARSMRELP